MPPVDQDIRNRLLVVRLPPLPHILLKLIEYCRTDRVGMAELAELISKDTAMAAKILGVANSSAYYRSGQKSRLEQSLMTLGTDMLRTLVINESVSQTFNGLATPASVNLREFWIHSLVNAAIARDIAKKTGYGNIDEAYLCGLLHDVGRLAFLAISPNGYKQLFMKEDTKELCQLEQEELQISHQEAGAWMADRWKLGSNVADSILYHHESVSRIEKTSLLVKVVYLSHVLSCHVPHSPEVTEAARLCSLMQDELENIKKNAWEKVKESAEFLGIELENEASADQEDATGDKSGIEKKLQKEIRHVVQASETERSFIKQTDEPTLLKTIAQSAYILYNISHAVVLMYSPETCTLSLNPNAEHPEQWANFSLQLKPDSKLAESIAGSRPAFLSHSNTPSQEDPLFNILQAKIIACIPLIKAGTCVGVLVGKIPFLKIADLRTNLRFIQVFGAQAAAALLSLRQKQEEMKTLTDSAVDEFKLTSRKIVHEANNPLTVIRNYLSVLNDKLHSQQPIGTEISVLNEEIDRVGNIIQKLVDPQPQKTKGLTNLNQIIEDISRMIRDSGFAPPAIKILTSQNAHAHTTECDDGKIWQIMLNLLKNAIEAMPNGGEVQINNKGHVNQNGRLYIDIEIKDTGPGIPQNVMEKIFTPVTSQKGGKHQGLGLAIVHDLIKELNGLINCRSNAEGTSFEILLPVRTTAAAT